jgi:hypothetical protein
MNSRSPMASCGRAHLSSNFLMIALHETSWSKCAHIGTSMETVLTIAHVLLVASNKKIFQKTRKKHSSPSWRAAGRRSRKQEAERLLRLGPSVVWPPRKLPDLPFPFVSNSQTTDSPQIFVTTNATEIFPLSPPRSDPISTPNIPNPWASNAGLESQTLRQKAHMQVNLESTNIQLMQLLSEYHNLPILPSTLEREAHNKVSKPSFDWSVNLIERLKQVIDTPCNTPTKSEFSCELSGKAAKHKYHNLPIPPSILEREAFGRVLEPSFGWPADLIERIKQVIDTPCDTPTKPKFSFELSGKAAM